MLDASLARTREAGYIQAPLGRIPGHTGRRRRCVASIRYNASPMRNWALAAPAPPELPIGRLPARGIAPSGDAAPAAAAAPGAAPLLEIRELSHWFHAPRRRNRAPGPPVLQAINLRVEPGEIVVLLGPSGCGKSTLLHLASGLSPRQQGSVRLLGQEIRGPDPRLGLVFQQPALLPWLSVRGNVEFGLTLRHSEKLPGVERRQRIQTALDLVGLPIDPETRPAHLSGGMAQRVALARVLVRQPRLLLLDEPFSALDAVTRAEMQELLLQIVQQTGAGALIVSHDVDEAIQLGDRILLMQTQPGTIEHEWLGLRGHDRHDDELLRHDLRRHDLKLDLRRQLLAALSDSLKSRSA